MRNLVVGLQRLHLPGASELVEVVDVRGTEVGPAGCRTPRSSETPICLGLGRGRPPRKSCGTSARIGRCSIRRPARLPGVSVLGQPTAAVIWPSGPRETQRRPDPATAIWKPPAMPEALESPAVGRRRRSLPGAARKGLRQSRMRMPVQSRGLEIESRSSHGSLITTKKRRRRSRPLVLSSIENAAQGHPLGHYPASGAPRMPSILSRTSPVALQRCGVG